MYTPAPPIRSGSFPRVSSKSNWEYKPTDPSSCSHLQGSLGPLPSHRTDIVWHELNTGIQFGICLNCQRQFWPEDHDYAYWRKLPSAQIMSSAINNDPVVPEEIPVIPTIANDVMGDFDIILFGPNAPQIIVRGRDIQ